MRGTMMDYPLTLPHLLERAGKLFPRVEMVSRRPDRSLLRTPTENSTGARAAWPRRSPGGAAPRGARGHADVEPLRAPREPTSASPRAAACCTRSTCACTRRRSPTSRSHAGDRFLIVDDVLLPFSRSSREQAAKLERVLVAPYGRAAPRAGAYESYEDFWPRPRPTISAIRRSMRTTPRPCATPRAPPASPRACSIRTARWRCTPSPSRCRTRWLSRTRIPS